MNGCTRVDEFAAGQAVPIAGGLVGYPPEVSSDYDSTILSSSTRSAVESRLKNENRMFASTTNFIQSHPRLRHSATTSSFTCSPRSKHSSSVRVDSASSVSSRFRSSSRASLSRTTARISSAKADFVCSSTEIPGRWTTISLISSYTLGLLPINNFFLPFVRSADRRHCHEPRMRALTSLLRSRRLFQKGGMVQRNPS